jgi:hypothetical protein
VLALSCKTAELQLVGLYHAGYKGHSALNVVVGIDQLREFMTKKRRVPRTSSPEGNPAMSITERKRVKDSLMAGSLPLFEFGGMHVMTEAQGDTLLYHIYGRDFPLDDRRMAVLEDRPGSAGTGEISRLWVRSDSGLREWQVKDLGSDEKDFLVRLGEAVRFQTIRVLAYRRTLASPNAFEERRRGRELLRTIERQSLPARELSGSLVDLVERLGPARDTPAVAAATTDAGAPAAPILRPPRAFDP